MSYCNRTTPRSGRHSRFRMSTTAATPATISGLRIEFSTWIAGVLNTTEGRRADITLAVYEAMANATEHAYPRDRPGEVLVRARYLRRTRTLRVLVRDRGRWWHHAKPLTGRGHGLSLIRGLCDRAVITSPAAGTTVDLNWTLIPAGVVGQST